MIPLILLAVGASLLTPAGRHQWALSLIRQPTRYTVLYFDDAANLPPTVVANRPLKVSFTVTNDEGHIMSYRYVLSATSSGISHVLHESTKTLAAGAEWTVVTVIRPACRASPCRIKVSLPGHPEAIDFLIKVLTPRVRFVQVAGRASNKSK